MQITTRITPVFIGLALLVAAFAIPAGAQTTTFTRDLTIGSTGADVTALQTWLISKGFSIPAGATGYFGTQTQAAVSAYQAANGITPTAGYFGPITRAKVNAAPATPAPSTDDEEDEDEDEDITDEDRAAEEIDDARDALADARDEVEEADDDGDDIGDSEELLDDAEDLLDDADDAFEDEDWREVRDLVEEANDLIDEALNEIDRGDGGSDVTTFAESNDRDGADNDFATFRIAIDLEALGEDIFVAQDASVSFEYEIRDSNGDEVSGATSMSATLRSSADKSGNYYLVREGDEESFTLTVVFDPLSSDEGESYYLRLMGVNFNDSEASPDQTWTASTRNSKYETKSVYIAD